MENKLSKEKKEDRGKKVAASKTAKTKNELRVKVPSEAVYGTGKRKTAIARVWLFSGDGNIIINKKDGLQYIKSDILFGKIMLPLKKLKLDKKYDCLIHTYRGGLNGQAEASQLGIVRALLNLNSEFRPALKEDGLITRDSRIKERKKYGRKKARKGFQYRKR